MFETNKKKNACMYPCIRKKSRQNDIPSSSYNMGNSTSCQSELAECKKACPGIKSDTDHGDTQNDAATTTGANDGAESSSASADSGKEEDSDPTQEVVNWFKDADHVCYRKSGQHVVVAGVSVTVVNTDVNTTVNIHARVGKVCKVKKGGVYMTTTRNDISTTLARYLKDTATFVQNTLNVSLKKLDKTQCGNKTSSRWTTFEDATDFISKIGLNVKKVNNINEMKGYIQQGIQEKIKQSICDAGKHTIQFVHMNKLNSFVLLMPSCSPDNNTPHVITYDEKMLKEETTEGEETDNILPSMTAHILKKLPPACPFLTNMGDKFYNDDVKNDLAQRMANATIDDCAPTNTVSEGKVSQQDTEELVMKSTTTPKVETVPVQDTTV